MLTEFLMKWFGEQSSMVASFQIALDLVVLVAVFLLFFLGRRHKGSAAGAEELMHSLERIIEDTKTIGKEFETNLHERQVLIQQLLTKLDQRVKDAQRVCDQLEDAQKAQANIVDHHASIPLQSDYRQVLILAQKGLNAEAIAKRLQKPLGEVELILNIQRLSSAG